MASTRLPGKPLAEIGGRAMILHVLDRAREADIGPVAVACADEVVAAAVRADGGTAVMTDPSVPSGSDRVQAALAQLDPAGRHDVVVNLQGDLPTMPGSQLRAVLTPLGDPTVDIATLVAPIETAAERAAPQVVKAACAFDRGRAVSMALYFSRMAVPWGEGPLWHHIGVYAYRRAALARFVSLPESPLERREKLEQLRALEAGMRIACARVGHAPFGVDTPEDLERARALLAKGNPMISFQGVPGAYSDLACRDAFPEMATLPCPTFDRAIRGRCARGRRCMACSLARTAWPGGYRTSTCCCRAAGCRSWVSISSGVEHCLLGVPGARLDQVRRVHSHAVALNQVRGLLRELQAEAVIEADTAGSAELVARWGRAEEAAVASRLAGEIYGLEVLRANVEDAAHNTTRFFVTARAPLALAAGATGLMTTFVFRVRNVPAALFKALGGFATNGVNMTRLESYMLGGQFTATQFMCDVDGHPEDPPLRRALEELAFFSRETRILGVYRRSGFREGLGRE